MLELGLRYLSKPWAAAVLVWIGVIFFSSTSLAERWAQQVYGFFTGQVIVPHAPQGLSYLLTDKGFHVTLFCIFALLLCQALATMPSRGPIVVLSGAIVGSCSEYLQSFFPGRDPAIHDVVINIAGTVLGLLLYSLLFRRFTLKRWAASTASTDL